MSERDEIYRQILMFGLVSLRNAAEAGDIAYCAIEAEHLHNVPTLIGESNHLRHDYYFETERTWYLERVNRNNSSLQFVLDRYEELWERLKDV